MSKRVRFQCEFIITALLRESDVVPKAVVNHMKDVARQLDRKYVETSVCLEELTEGRVVAFHLHVSGRSTRTERHTYPRVSIMDDFRYWLLLEIGLLGTDKCSSDSPSIDGVHYVMVESYEGVEEDSLRLHKLFYPALG